MNQRILENIELFKSNLNDIEIFVKGIQHEELNKSIKQCKKKSFLSIKKKKINQNETFVDVQRVILGDEKMITEILKKFKTSINLLADLKSFIHNPNAPELCHVLFTPLQYVYNVLSTIPNGMSLCKSIWSPVLTRQAKELLSNCLTSKESDLWHALGESWSVCDEELMMKMHYKTTSSVIDYGGISKRNGPMSYQGSIIGKSETHYFDGDNMRNWAESLSQNGIKIFEVISDRKGNNDKELTVKCGEFVEVLDDRRNWWRIRNIYGQIGHVPNTILKDF